MRPPLRKAFVMNSARVTTNEEKEWELFLQHTNRDSCRTRWDKSLSLKWDLEPLLNDGECCPRAESPTQVAQHSPVVSVVQLP